MPLNRRVGFTLVMLAILVAMVGMAAQYPPDARFMPWVVGIPAIALCLLQLGRELGAARRAAGEAQGEPGTLPREAVMWSYFLGLVGGILFFGFLLAVPAFLLVFLRQRARASWPLALGLVVAASLIYYLVFVEGLNVALHQGFITEYLLERFSD
jgi:hypothetical protein